MKVLIVGGVAGGASTAARLRRLDESAEIIIFERDAYVSYANCGLPYYIGDVIPDRESLLLQTPESLRRRLNLDVRVLSEVISIDRECKSVRVRRLEDGGEYEEGYDKLLLSTGANAVRPPIPGTDNGRVFVLRSIADTFKLKEYIEENEPESAAVAGGGFIGLEVAENLFRLGIEVSVIEMLDHVVASLDADMAAEVHSYMREKGISLYLGNGVTAVEENSESLTVKLKNGEIKADILILAVGVRPESALARDCGLTLNARGAIITDASMKTSDENIYAVGDAVQIKNPVTGKDGYVPLAGPANKQGRIAADNICGGSSEYKGTQGSSVMRLFKMTVASTGLNERAAAASGLNFGKTYLWEENHAIYYPGAENMTIKVIFEKPTGRILGAQLVGYEGVDKRCDVFAAAIRAGMTARDLAELELCYAPPYSSAKDPVNMAGFVIENLLEGKYRQVFWHDVERLRKESGLQIVDLRPADAYKDGFIEGAVNIPLAQLRPRLGSLDKSKPILFYCAKGQNSYIACRALTQLGYDCVSLAGGWHVYSTNLGC